MFTSSWGLRGFSKAVKSIKKKKERGKERETERDETAADGSCGTWERGGGRCSWAHSTDARQYADTAASLLKQKSSGIMNTYAMVIAYNNKIGRRRFTRHLFLHAEHVSFHARVARTHKHNFVFTCLPS